MAKERKGPGIAWWVAVGVGSVLTFIPEPVTSAAGLAILSSALLLGAADKGDP